MSFAAFFCDAEIVRVNPAAILRVRLADGIDTERRADPLALAGIESIFHVRPLLAVKRIRKSAHGNWSQRTLWCVARHHRNPKPYILDPCWLKTRFDYRRRNSGKDLGLLLGIRLRIAANRVHYFEGITFQPKAQPCMIKSLNDQPAFLTILLRAISARVSSPRTEAATNCPSAAQRRSDQSKCPRPQSMYIENGTSGRLPKYSAASRARRSRTRVRMCHPGQRQQYRLFSPDSLVRKKVGEERHHVAFLIGAFAERQRA